MGRIWPWLDFLSKILLELPRVERNMGQIWPWLDFVRKIILEHSCIFFFFFNLLSVAAFTLQQYSWVVATQMTWPAEPKILWFFREGVFSRVLILQVLSVDQQLWHCLKTCCKCRISGLLYQNLHSNKNSPENAHWSLSTTEPESSYTAWI